MGLSLNKMVKPQTIELNEKASVFSKEKSPSKRLYVEGRKPKFNRNDVFHILKNIKNIYKLPYSINKTVKLIKEDTSTTKRHMSRVSFEELDQLLNSLQVDEYGFFEVTPEKIFKECGVPHKYALVFS
ncbi:hypothetical protein GOQ27_02850 [Clostridium sp. D2Q-11]|uniref:Uncharacterized protein n=1 Tax=Anaeromonas frigoriresistens TaxID=2683708 RepID=A0A942Z6A9_9FIRM|nr:hypothetical protein [Anaeromonas frigoriresistens]MBS4537382.1 hypothetical protein [Anaeromonas frigoriresistens]